MLMMSSSYLETEECQSLERTLAPVLSLLPRGCHVLGGNSSSSAISLPVGVCDFVLQLFPQSPALAYELRVGLKSEDDEQYVHK